MPFVRKSTKKFTRRPKKSYTRYTKRSSAVTKTAVRKVVKAELNKQVETKRFSTTFANTDYSMGQITGNSNGYFADDITPEPTLGTGVANRIGNDIKLTGCYMTLQLRQMSAATAPNKITFYIVRMKGDYQLPVASFVDSMFNPTEYIGAGSTIYDTQSSLNTDYMGIYRIVKKFNVYIKPDQFSGQQMPVVKNIPLSFKKKPATVRFFSTGTGIAYGRYFIVALCSNGNCSTVTASTLANVPVQGINTGVLINYSIKWYYHDA